MLTDWGAEDWGVNFGVEGGGHWLVLGFLFFGIGLFLEFCFSGVGSFWDFLFVGVL